MNSTSEYQDLISERQQANLKVTKSNSLINAHYDLNTTEMRVLRSSIAKINSIEAEAPSKIKLFASEYGETYDCVNPYKELKEAADKLFESEMSYFDASRGRQHRARWVQHIVYQDGEGSVTLEFSTVVKEHLSDLSRNFTSYHLRHIGALKSKYSIRFYELLYQYKKIGKRSFAVEEIRKLFKLENKYPLFSDFRKFVLVKSIAEINKFSDLMVEYSLIKSGSSVIEIEFAIMSKPQKELDI